MQCKAQARSTGQACRAPALANGLCRHHGGRDEHAGLAAQDRLFRAIFGIDRQRERASAWSEPLRPPD